MSAAPQSSSGRGLGISRRELKELIDLERRMKPTASSKESDVGTGAEAGIEGLTLYEAHREPMVLHDEDSDQTTTIQVRTLNVELTCPICLGIMRNTMTLMECLHRFCAECISKCLRVGKRECPTCRVHCSSRRQLRPDPEFDALIASVYPNLDEYEAQEEEFIADLNKKMSCQSHLTESVQKGILRQRSATSAAATRKRKASAASSDSTAANSALSSPSLPSSTTSTSPSRPARDTTAASSHPTKRQKTTRPGTEQAESLLNTEDLVSFLLLPRPDMRRTAADGFALERPYVSTSPKVTVKHIEAFLASKFPLLLTPGSQAHFVISVATSPSSTTEDAEYVDLEAGDKTIDDLVSEFGTPGSTLTLYYRLAGSSPSPPE